MEWLQLQLADCTRPLRKTVQMVNQHIPAPRVFKPGWDDSVSQPVDHKYDIRYQKVAFKWLKTLLTKNTNKPQALLAGKEASKANGCYINKQMFKVQPTFDLVATETLVVRNTSW